MARRKYRRRKYTRRKGLFKFRLKQGTVYTICALILFAAAFLIGLSIWTSAPLLLQLRTLIESYLGWEIYLLPILLLSLGLLFLRLKFRITRPNVTAGLFITAISLLGLTKAGNLGQYFYSVVAPIISGPGALLLFLLTTATGLIILFNTSLDKIILAIANFLAYLKELFDKYIMPDVSTLFEKKEPVFAQKNKGLKIHGIEEDKRTIQDQQQIPKTLEPLKTQKSLDKQPVKSELFGGAVTNIDPTKLKDWEYPPLNLLDSVPGQKADHGDIKRNADIIEKTLESFGIRAKVVEVNLGPAVTQYALNIALGTKLSKITALSNDLALALAAPTGLIRIEAPIPGRSLVGIEVPNRTLEFVTLHKMLISGPLPKAESALAVALGLNVSGKPVITDIIKMPHVLIAGTTGAGKSVLINAWITSILYRTTPAQVRLILVDPKRVELIDYNGIPHLLTDVIVEPKKIISALRWAISEMERRYKEFARMGARNINSYNGQAGFQAMPYIVIIIDELADLMAFAPADVEDSITRLAQMARATGIHLIISTQRPSVDVITGLMKANVPCRIAFNVSSQVDSRVIIDQTGAEKLLGRGDMLYIPPDQAKPTRIQGVFVSDREIKKLVDFLRSRKVEIEYTDDVTEEPVAVRSDGKVVSMTTTDRDELFDDAFKLICQHDKASASLLQRRLSIGYARAARILDQLYAAGVVGPPEGSKPRDVLIKNPQMFYEMEQAKMVGS